MNKIEKATLIGLVLGDGHIDCSKNKDVYTNSAITFIHCKKQKEYLEWKAEILHQIFGGNKPKVIEFLKNKVSNMLERIKELVSLQDDLYIEPKNKLEIIQNRKDHSLEIKDESYFREQKQIERDDFDLEL